MKKLKSETTGEIKKHTLKNGSKLSEEIGSLPHGIIDKRETGIGATFAELTSKRNSIIVEPLKVTAVAKSKEHNAFYYGSDTDTMKRPTIKEIKNFLNNKSIKYKKIIVVSDSLPKLMQHIPKEERENYFLMIDEVDSVQMDSGFRPSMEKVMKIYKEHPQNMRCLITATILEFHDPALQHEPYHQYEYETPTVRDINIIATENPIGLAFDKIEQLLNHNEGEKIVLAYNNVTVLNEVAKRLVEKGGLEKYQVGILCGASSKEKTDFYTELTSDTLPTLVNLKTSAYYNGYDIKEKYHLLTIVDGKDSYNSLSEKNLKQISGRARNGLLSETIIVMDNGEIHTEEILTEDLIKAAQYEIDALDCIRNHFDKNNVLKNMYGEIQGLISEKVNVYNYPILKINEEGKFEISYLRSIFKKLLF